MEELHTPARTTPRYYYILNGRKIQTTDPVLAVDVEGKPIFGYNENGRPICNSRRSVHWEGSDEDFPRCTSTLRQQNGRCIKHGGKTPAAGEAAKYARSQEYRDSLPQRMAEKLERFANDPKYANLQDEIALNTLQIVSTLEAFSDETVDSGTWKEVQKLGKRLEKLLFESGLQEMLLDKFGSSRKIAEMENIAEELVLRIKSGARTHELYMELNKSAEYRRRLIETDLKVQAAKRNSIPADQALSLFKQLADTVKTVFSKYPEELKMFSAELDKISLEAAMSTGTNPLQAKMTPSGVMNPESRLGNDIRKHANTKSLPAPAIDVDYEVESEQSFPEIMGVVPKKVYKRRIVY